MEGLETQPDGRSTLMLGLAMQSADVWNPNDAVIVGEFCSMTCGPARNVGYRGVRVGEASHPGPGTGFVLHLRRGHNRFNALFDDLHSTVLDGTHGLDTESVVDALEFDMARGDEVDQAPSTPRAVQVDDDEAVLVAGRGKRARGRVGS